MEPATNQPQRRGSFPVIASILSDGAGPIPRQVMVSGGSSVKPLSTIRAAGKPAFLAFL